MAAGSEKKDYILIEDGFELYLKSKIRKELATGTLENHKCYYNRFVTWCKEKEALLSLRAMAPAENITLYVKSGDNILYKKKHKKIFPSEMQRIPIEKIPAGAKALDVFFE